MNWPPNCPCVWECVYGVCVGGYSVCTSVCVLMCVWACVCVYVYNSSMWSDLHTLWEGPSPHPITQTQIHRNPFSSHCITSHQDIASWVEDCGCKPEKKTIKRHDVTKCMPCVCLWECIRARAHTRKNMFIHVYVRVCVSQGESNGNGIHFRILNKRLSKREHCLKAFFPSTNTSKRHHWYQRQNFP